MPCGHCLGCRADQARSWAVRLVHEAHEPPRPAWFVTLTYCDDEVPEYHSLDRGHPTRFLKRLRRRLEGQRLSYYICGEYGDRTQRPHYHAVLYGPGFLDRDIHRYASGAPVFRSAELESAWGHGLCEFTGLNYAAARYVAGYVRKKVRQRDHPNHYMRVDPKTGELVELEKEYGRMSRRPALGLQWIRRYWRDVYPRDFVVMDGQELKPPRFYDKWMDEHHPEVMEKVREKRYAEMQENGVDYVGLVGESVPRQLVAREKLHESKVNLFQSRDAV